MKVTISIFKFLSIFFTILSTTTIDCSAQNSQFDHAVFDQLLKKHVNENGRVDYQNFSKDQPRLRQYLNSLSRNAPDTLTWSKAEQLAYWLNLYNAFTTELILDHYPLESIKDIGTKIPIVFGNSAWDIEFIHIGKRTYTLDQIENEVLKNNFDEPRVHFALVCAASSCPDLRREAYVADKLESQLNSQAVIFLSNPIKNKIGTDKSTISEIFKWYEIEFTKEGTLVDYLNQFTRSTISSNAEIDYFKFDWSLNELK
jgi:hypothetical protein